MDYHISSHALEQAATRGISEVIINEIMLNPDQIVDDESGEQGQKVF